MTRISRETTRRPVNHGVMLDLEHGSQWKVTGMSYLTKLCASASSPQPSATWSSWTAP